MIVGTGERLACLLFAHLLQSVALDAVYVSLDKCVDASFGESKLDQPFYDHLRLRLADIILDSTQSSEHANSVSLFTIPVVTGFLGSIPGGIVNAVGRGYTDLTAGLTQPIYHESRKRFFSSHSM